MCAYFFAHRDRRCGLPLAQSKTAMSALNIIDRYVSPVAAMLMLAALPVAFVGFFAQGF